MKYKLEIKSIYIIFIFQFLLLANSFAQNKKYMSGQVNILESVLNRQFPNNPWVDKYYASNKLKIGQLQKALNDSINELKTSSRRLMNDSSPANMSRTKEELFISEIKKLNQQLFSSRDTIELLYKRLNRCESSRETVFRNLEGFDVKSNVVDEKIREVDGKVQELEKIIEELKYGKETKYYKITRMREREIVLGKRGLYFAIDFINPEAKQILYFEESQYYIDIFDTKYQESLSEFDRDVMKTIRNGKKEYEVFVRGSADLTTTDFRKKLNQRYQYNSISFLKRSDNHVQYDYAELQEIIKENYSNKNLPNLRAKFIVNELNESDPVNYPITKLHILDGTVTPKIDPKDRNVKIYLYLKD